MNLTVRTKSHGLQRIGEARGAFGYTHGLRQPALILKLRVGRPLASNAVKHIDRLVRQQFGLDDDPINKPSQCDPHIAQLLSWSRAILQKYGQPIFEDALAFQEPSDPSDIWTIVHPCLFFQGCLGVMELCMSLMELAETNVAAPGREQESSVRALAEKYADLLERGRIPGFNSIHFLMAATELGIPWTRLSNLHFQFGHGASSRLLDSSLTDRTPQISANLARDKILASALLRAAAMPVAEQKIAKSADEAAAIAEQIGFPVVVKPADQDGGVGVSAFLLDAAAVRRAFAQAQDCSSIIVIEKHFSGRDYRIQIVNDEVHGILERAPGGVTGDGRHTVRNLVERQNRERANATDDRRHLHAIEFDDDAEALLAHAGMSWSSTPQAGQFVRLRGAANVASGGTPLPVPLDIAHPDNLDLARRAARILRLDVAGIDLITPDISRSWFETGAIICEVNSQPQMFTTMHKPMLQSLLNGSDGRIPIVLVLSPGPAEDVSAPLHELMRSVWPNVGLFDRHGLRIGEKAVIGKTLELFHGAQALMKDPAVEAIIVATHPAALRNGWPFDRVDTLVLAGDEPSDGDGATQDMHRLIEAANWLKPRHVLIDSHSRSFAAAHDQFEASETCEVIGDGCGPADMGTMLAHAAFSSLTGTQALPAATPGKKQRSAKPLQKA